MKRPVALVVVEAVVAVSGDVEVVVAVVVVVADAGALSPAGVGEAGFGGDIGECAIVVVMKEVAGGRGRSGLAGSSMCVVPLTRKMSGQPSLS